MKIEKYLLFVLAVILLIVVSHILLDSASHMASFVGKHR